MTLTNHFRNTMKPLHRHKPGEEAAKILHPHKAINKKAKQKKEDQTDQKDPSKNRRVTVVFPSKKTTTPGGLLHDGGHGATNHQEVPAVGRGRAAGRKWAFWKKGENKELQAQEKANEKQE